MSGLVTLFTTRMTHNVSKRFTIFYNLNFKTWTGINKIQTFKFIDNITLSDIKKMQCQPSSEGNETYTHLDSNHDYKIKIQ